MNKTLAVLTTLKKAIELSHYNNSGVTFGKNTIAEIDEAMSEVEEYESEMDGYLDYTTGGRCSKSRNADQGAIRRAHDEHTAKLHIINLCDGCKYEYWSYGKKFCQKDYECQRGCSTYPDHYEERE